MTDIEEIVVLILPELKAFIFDKSIEINLQKGLDNKENPSIHCVQEETRND